MPLWLVLLSLTSFGCTVGYPDYPATQPSQLWGDRVAGVIKENICAHMDDSPYRHAFVGISRAHFSGVA